MAVDIYQQNYDNCTMDWKKIIYELQATGISQAAIGAAVGKSQGWVSAVYAGEYSDVRWRDGEALRKLHAEKLGADTTAQQPHQEAA